MNRIFFHNGVRPILFGLLAGGVVVAQRILVSLRADSIFESPLWLGLVPLTLVLFSFLSRRAVGAYFYGLANLLIHIHRPPRPGSAERWGLRSLVSFFISVLGGRVGVEGAAIEGAQALAVATRPASNQWFEQSRRTDVTCCLAAGLSAAFGAPLAAILLPMELKIGGRYLSAVVSSLVAFSVTYLAQEWMGTASASGISPVVLSVSPQDQIRLLLEQAGGLAIVVLAAITASVLLSLAIRFGLKSFDTVSGETVVKRWVIGGIFLVAIAWAYPSPLLIHVQWFEGLRQHGIDLQHGLFFLASMFLALLVLVTAFGSTGFFWPTFLFGGMVGAITAGVVDVSLEWSVFLAGAVTWSVFFGSPLTAAVLVFELSRSPELMLISLVLGVVIAPLMAKLKIGDVISVQLSHRGLVLQDGRSQSIMEGLKVSRAMIRDHQTIQDNENLEELYGRLHRSSYPFLGVVDRNGEYMGILTADLVERAWEHKEKSSATEERSMAHLIEARDLLYQGGIKIEPVRTSDPLAVANERFGSQPVLPVVDDEKKLVGLLFHHESRIAYDAEMARQSLRYSLQQTELSVTESQIQSDSAPSGTKPS